MPQVVITLTQTETGFAADVAGDMPLSGEQRQHLGEIAGRAVMLAASGMDGTTSGDAGTTTSEGAPDPIDPDAPPLMDGDDDGAPFAGDPDSPGHPE